MSRRWPRRSPKALARLSLDAPEVLTDPHFIPRLDDDDADPELIAAIAAMRPIRTAAVLVPIIARAEPTVLFTQRTAHLSHDAGEISFPGGKIEAVDASPAAAALREAEEEDDHERLCHLVQRPEDLGRDAPVYSVICGHESTKSDLIRPRASGLRQN